VACICPEGLIGTHVKPVRISDVPAEIRTGYLPNRRQRQLAREQWMDASRQLYRPGRFTHDAHRTGSGSGRCVEGTNPCFRWK
jgi:hypothetical protein